MNTQESGGTYEGFDDAERAAMKERAKELKKGKKGKKADPEADLLEKIAEMPSDDRALAERLHELISTEVPELSPRTWYGQPAYAKDGKVICFFQAAAKFGTEYATFGFNEAQLLDNGTMWPTAFGLTRLTSEDEKLLISLVKQASGLS